MLRNTTEDGRLTGGQSSSSRAGHGVPSGGLVSQESSWIGLLSVVSRPAMSFLQKYLPGRSHAPGATGGGPQFLGTAFDNSFIDEQRDFLSKLEHVMPLGQHAAAHLTYLRCQQDGAAGLMEHERSSAAPWITAASLREIGIEGADDVTLCPQTQAGYLSSVRTFLSHVLMNPVSAQEVSAAGGADWARGSKEGPRWGRVWGGGDTRVLFSDLSWVGDETNCPQQRCADPPATETTRVCVQPGSGEESTVGEHTGATEHKEEPTDNGGLRTEQSTEPPPPDLGIADALSSSGGAVCGETPLLTPDQDNGYSSLEEEHFHLVKASNEEAQPTTENCAVNMESEENTSENTDEEEPQHLVDGGQSVVAVEFPTPECQNKAIAFIMGCPCSDDDSSQSELSDDDDDDDDDDDGFDSEGSSELSDSSDSGSDSDSDVDSESERLLNSLSQTLDPYNPRNFSAQLCSTPPRSIPVPTPPSSAQSTPDPSPNLASSATSPLSDPDVWDDSTSASEADEAESSRLWSSFSCSSDPYSPFNFQATYRTQEPSKAAPRAHTRKASQSARRKTVSPPECSKDEVIEQQESGVSETATSSVPSDPSPSSSFPSSPSAASTKKVRFCDHVEEIVLGSEEDRRGPWEELARDRCRFQRRCQEVEESIGFCLQSQHRLLVYSRITVLEEEHALQHVSD